MVNFSSNRPFENWPLAMQKGDKFVRFTNGYNSALVFSHSKTGMAMFFGLITVFNS
jgi:hypothetical protein